ncbi:MAG: TIGR04283 family arsenosugar biosynthesis glycosyltransferase [Acetobacteraceae bacterium]
MISVVTPALNAARRIGATLAAVAAAGERIVVDGGSTDATAALARAAGARVLSAPRGRGGQLAAGIAAARLPWLLLLHADTVLTAEWPAAATRLIATGPARAGYFRLRLDSPDPRARRLERAVALRCRMLALPYGDQGLLIHRDLLAAAGGIRPLPLMEDVDLIRRLGRARLCALDAAAVTAADRWERDGWLRRSARNLACLAGWFAGIPPSRLARWYR